MTTFVAEFFNDGLDTPDTLTDLVGTPALASFPRLRRWPLGVVPDPLRKSFRELREQLTLLDRGDHTGPRFIAVTSAQPDAGVSTVASGLARSLAHYSRGGVTLVDANFDDPRLTLTLADENAFGISDAFADSAGKKAPLHPMDLDVLHLMPVGRGRKMLLDRLDPDRLMQVMRHWTSSFAYVIVDLPPITSSNAFAAIAGACEHCVIVVEAGKTRWQVVRKTAEIVTLANAGLAGAVLNKRRFPIPAWLYRTL